MHFVEIGNQINLFLKYKLYHTNQLHDHAVIKLFYVNEVMELHIPQYVV